MAEPTAAPEPTPAPGPPARQPHPATDLLERATALRQDAVHHLTLLAGDASMCAIGRSGRSFPAAKYHEGRQAAAGQVRRALRADSSAGPAVLDPLLEDWTRTLDSAATKGTGPDNTWRRPRSGTMPCRTSTLIPMGSVIMPIAGSACPAACR